MPTFNLLILIVVVWIIPIFVATSIGRGKHRDGWAYGIFLGWLGVLIVALLPALPDRDEKQCPDCAEWVREEAAKCRFCGFRFDEIEDGIRERTT